MRIRQVPYEDALKQLKDRLRRMEYFKGMTYEQMVERLQAGQIEETPDITDWLVTHHNLVALTDGQPGAS